MGENGANANANINGAAPAPYVILFHLLKIMFQILMLAISLQSILAHYMVDCMTSCISISLVMFYLLFQIGRAHV